MNFTTATGHGFSVVVTALPAIAAVVDKVDNCVRREPNGRHRDKGRCFGHNQFRRKIQGERDEQQNSRPSQELLLQPWSVHQRIPFAPSRPGVGCCLPLGHSDLDASRTEFGQHSDMSSAEDQIDRSELIGEIRLLRERGLAQLPTLQLPELHRLARLIDPDPAVDDRARVETALRRAVERLGGGPYGESAGLLFGLVQGTRAHSSRIRREEAAAAIDKVADTFRKRYEPAMIEEIADSLVGLTASQIVRDAWDEMESRHPADSRLAVHWAERFESYYRIWTPIYALGADLTAARSTMLEVDRPYDRAPGRDGSDDRGYTQEDQAAGYAAFALFRYAWFLWELRQFMNRYGGLWLFASAEAELAVRDAVYRIGWHVTPLNEQDDSWLRLAIEESPRQEMHPFLTSLKDTPIGRATVDEWCDWVAECSCTWIPTATEDDYFPTAEHHSKIDPNCQMHLSISACANYCHLIDHEWHKVADWYHLGELNLPKPASGESLYQSAPRLAGLANPATALSAGLPISQSQERRDSVRPVPSP